MTEVIWKSPNRADIVEHVVFDVAVETQVSVCKASMTCAVVDQVKLPNWNVSWTAAPC